MTDLPAPPIADDVDLRAYRWMPLDVVALRESRIVDAVSGEAFRAAVLLWCVAWHQVPAGSLPDDDAQLAKFAGFGRVVKEWQKTRDGALHGFVKCVDGRLYHPFICEKAQEAWDSRRSAVSRGKAGAAKRWPAGIAKPSKPNGHGNGSATEKHSDREGKRKDIENTGRKNSNGGGDVAVLSEVDFAFDLYDHAAEKLGWEACAKRHKARRSALNARLKDAAGIDGWRAALERAAASDFCMGRVRPTAGHKQFKNNIDFMVREGSFTRLMEGFYDNRGGGPLLTGADSATAAAARWLAEREGNTDG